MSFIKQFDDDGFETKQKLRNQFLQIESMRDFIVWLCEIELDSTVSEMQEEFEKYEKKQSNTSKTK